MTNRERIEEIRMEALETALKSAPTDLDGALAIVAVAAECRLALSGDMTVEKYVPKDSQPAS